MNNKNSSCR